MTCEDESMRRTWTLVLILVLVGAVTSWIWLPSSAATGLCLVAAFAVFVCLKERGGPK